MTDQPDDFDRQDDIDRPDDFARRILDRYAPGRVVLDVGLGTVGRGTVGRGTGGPAIALARAGYEVTTVDVRTDAAWPVGTVDAAVCLRWCGWGSEHEQRRLLRRLRRHLRPGGVLVIGHATIDDHATIDGHATIDELVPAGSPPPDLDPVTGRLRGTVPGAAGPVPYDLRWYTPTELVTLVRGAGFSVEQVSVGPAPEHPARVVARPLPGPPGALAVASWGTPAQVRLDLRYAPDEAAWLDPSPDDVWADLIAATPRFGAEVVSGYPVDDPYGGGRGAAAVGRFFGCTVGPDQLTFAAGVTSLLHDLSDLADGGPVLAPELVHPDLPVWALSRGAQVWPVAEPADASGLIDALRATRPALLHLDRPAFGGGLLSLDELVAVIRAAAAVGAPVVIDESPAPYLGPAGSAVQLLRRTDNLVVLRGFTKAYSWGGLRGGYALASPRLAGRVRELVAPMQIGELALRAALRLLEAGDVFGALRRRVRAVKPAFVTRLTAAGLTPLDGHPDLPWVVVTDPDGATSRLLSERGIHGLAPVPLPVLPAPAIDLLHLAVPLSDARMALFDELLAVPTPAHTPVPVSAVRPGGG